MQESRLFKIVYHLLNKGHTTAPELAKKMEVSVRTIYRDIEALSEAGIPIYTETGRGGGIYLMSDFVLGKAMLSEMEKKELLDEGIEPASLPEYQDTLDQEYRKFVFLFSKEVTYRVYDEFNHDLVQRQENGDLQLPTRYRKY